jgi:acyl dehydratase
MALQILPLEEMKKELGKELGVTDWFLMDQDRINQFADCTLDHQWIHVDEEAAAKGPFGKTVAHGYLTVSLLSHFAESHMVAPEGTTMAINYGMNKLRLLSPVTVGSKIRDRIAFIGLEEKPQGILVTTSHTVEIEGQDKPALFAEMLSMFFTA